VKRVLGNRFFSPDRQFRSFSQGTTDGASDLNDRREQQTPHANCPKRKLKGSKKKSERNHHPTAREGNSKKGNMS